MGATAAVIDRSIDRLISFFVFFLNNNNHNHDSTWRGSLHDILHESSSAGRLVACLLFATEHWTNNKRAYNFSFFPSIHHATRSRKKRWNCVGYKTMMFFLPCCLFVVHIYTKTTHQPTTQYSMADDDHFRSPWRHQNCSCCCWCFNFQSTCNSTAIFTSLIWLLESTGPSGDLFVVKHRHFNSTPALHTHSLSVGVNTGTRYFRGNSLHSYSISNRYQPSCKDIDSILFSRFQLNGARHVHLQRVLYNL